MLRASEAREATRVECADQSRQVEANAAAATLAAQTEAVHLVTKLRGEVQELTLHTEMLHSEEEMPRRRCRLRQELLCLHLTPWPAPFRRQPSHQQWLLGQMSSSRLLPGARMSQTHGHNGTHGPQA